MNLYIKKLSFLLLSLAFVFTACETEESIEITSPEPALVLQQPGISNVFLNFGIPDNPALTMSWNDNLTSSSSYDVEMALDADFTSTVNLGNVSSKSLSISVEELNNSIRDAGATSYVDIAIYVRVDAGEAISNSVQYLVTTYPTEAPVISSPSENDEFILSIGSLDEVAMTIDWTDAVLSSDLGIDVNYVIQAAAIETDFEAPVTIGTSTNGTSITSTHSELNAIAIGIGLTPDVSGDMEIRIIGKNTNANGNVLERISDVVTVSVTSFSVSFPYLYQVGDASTAGWDNNNNNTPIFRNQDIPNAYVYTGYFKAGAFKMLETKGSWHPQWGAVDGSTLGVSNLDGSNEPGTFNVGTAGYYTYNFTTVGESGSYSVTPFDASGAITYSSMDIIGSATPLEWGAGTSFTQDPNNPHLWFLNDVTLTNGGEFLIRGNGNWDDGVFRYTGSTELYGKARLDNAGGDNFPFSEPTGSYNMWFNDLDGTYVIIPN